MERRIGHFEIARLEFLKQAQINSSGKSIWFLLYTFLFLTAMSKLFLKRWEKSFWGISRIFAASVATPYATGIDLHDIKIQYNTIKLYSIQLKVVSLQTQFPWNGVRHYFSARVSARDGPSTTTFRGIMATPRPIIFRQVTATVDAYSPGRKPEMDGWKWLSPPPQKKMKIGQCCFSFCLKLHFNLCFFDCCCLNGFQTNVCIRVEIVRVVLVSNVLFQSIKVELSWVFPHIWK